MKRVIICLLCGLVVGPVLGVSAGWLTVRYVLDIDGRIERAVDREIERVKTGRGDCPRR